MKRPQIEGDIQLSTSSNAKAARNGRSGVPMKMVRYLCDVMLT